MILIVTYDLRTTKDYHDFYEAIKAQGERGKWWHYMASTWLLSTMKPVQEVYDAIRPYLDIQDFMFICELNPNYQGWLPQPAWDWIKTELPQIPAWNKYFAGLSVPGAAVEPPSNPFLAPPGLPIPPATTPPDAPYKGLSELIKAHLEKKGRP